MPRIRTIKPEFWSDEKLAPLDVLTRFVFLGLISMADDAGRLLDNVKSIDGFLFPETDDTSREALDTLARLSRISRYTVASGSRVIQVVNWSKHQKVDRPSTYVLPAEPSRECRETLDNSSRSDLGPRTLDQGSGTVDQGAATNAAREVGASEAALASQFPIHAADLLAFLGLYEPEKRDAWAKETLMLCARYGPAHIAQVCRDGMITKIDTPLGLRAFAARHKREVVAEAAEDVTKPRTRQERGVQNLKTWLAEENPNGK